MSLHIFGITSNSLSALFALAAALLWYRSATVKVLDHPGGTGNPEMVVNGTLFVSTALAQSTWSRRAAYMAAAAAFFQACGMVAAQAAA
jgi:ABC-type molybdenum transport system ATPase subunit/photorepair protein PhrA